MRFALTSFLALVLLPCGALAVQERGRSDDEKKERERKRESRRKVEKADSAEPSRFWRREEPDERANEWLSLLRNVKRRRPELAGRLNELLKKNPKRFEDVLMRALMRQVEESLGRQERREREREGTDRPPRRGRERDGVQRTPRPQRERAQRPPRPLRERDRAELMPRSPREPFPEMRPPGPPGLRPADEPRLEIRREGFQRRLEELRRRNDDSEIRSRELATELRRRIRGGEGPRGPASMREHLRETVGEHFELRSELRRLDLTRIEAELARLKEAVNRLRSELEIRSHERSAIIERRIRQLTEDKD